MNWPHAIVTGLLIGAVYWASEQSGLLDGKSKRQRLAIMLPIYFVVILLLNLIWPR